ncbi:MAG: DUF3892 domain-containing protein [Chloroflexota bacterium]|nr:DUF3892 domain-containing protein [Chloroflexota bacterium]
MNTTQAQVQQIQVTCINKVNRASGHEGITHLGGVGWKWTRQQMIVELESPHPRHAFYTRVNGRTAWIGVNSGPHGKYLQTHADGYWNNNLLALPECL